MHIKRSIWVMDEICHLRVKFYCKKQFSTNISELQHQTKVVEKAIKINSTTVSFEFNSVSTINEMSQEPPASSINVKTSWSLDNPVWGIPAKSLTLNKGGEGCWTKVLTINAIVWGCKFFLIKKGWIINYLIDTFSVSKDYCCTCLLRCFCYISVFVNTGYS